MTKKALFVGLVIISSVLFFANVAMATPSVDFTVDYQGQHCTRVNSSGCSKPLVVPGTISVVSTASDPSGIKSEKWSLGAPFDDTVTRQFAVGHSAQFSVSKEDYYYLTLVVTANDNSGSSTTFQFHAVQQADQPAHATYVGWLDAAGTRHGTSEALRLPATLLFGSTGQRKQHFAATAEPGGPDLTDLGVDGSGLHHERLDSRPTGPFTLYTKAWSVSQDAADRDSFNLNVAKDTSATFINPSTALSIFPTTRQSHKWCGVSGDLAAFITHGRISYKTELRIERRKGNTGTWARWKKQAASGTATGNHQWFTKSRFLLLTRQSQTGYQYRAVTVQSVSAAGQKKYAKTRRHRFNPKTCTKFNATSST